MGLAVVGALAIGLQELLEPAKGTVIEEPDPWGRPDDGRAVRLLFDPTDPRRTYALVRPHLLKQRRSA